ncbi:ImpA family type VI secretion system protein [Novosphingobium bradum]|uniref:ImpA family type VI secretion system protein n=1 Tax=Novosphingobium bradum TaxID=1737444 RepID=A0ABV7IRH6_9SPHN
MLVDEERREALLAPIFESVGIDGREDEGAAGDLLREIRSQRKALVRLEQAAAMVDEDVDIPEGAWDWETIGENALDYLATHGKDLEAGAVLIEAAARGEGLGDLAAALEAVADMVEAWWDQGLFPVEDDDGVETRFQPLSGLSGGSQDKDGALILPLRRLTIAPSGLRLLDKVRGDGLMESSQSLSGDAKAARMEEAQQAYHRITEAVRRTPASQLATVAATAQRCEQAWQRMIGFIAERTSPRLPAASRLTDELRGLSAWLASLAPEQAGADGVAAAPTGDADEGAAPAGGPAGGNAGAAAGGGFVAGRITRREDALAAVSAAADYFQLHEPLSPLGSTLREVDRRARLSLHDLLAELIPDDSARNDFYWRSGIRPPAQPSNDIWGDQ